MSIFFVSFAIETIFLKICFLSLIIVIGCHFEFPIFLYFLPLSSL
jgi:hypothetical protein